MTSRPTFLPQEFCEPEQLTTHLGLERADRVRLLGECFRALIEGKMPSRKAALFVAGGGLAWLREGGNLARDFWKVTKPKSRHTPSYLWQQMDVHRDEGKAETDPEE